MNLRIVIASRSSGEAIHLFSPRREAHPSNPSWIPAFLVALLCILGSPLAESAPAFKDAEAFIDQNCASCHNDVDQEAKLDLTSLSYDPEDPVNFTRWVKVHDRVKNGEMPPKKKPRPDTAALSAFVTGLSSTLIESETNIIQRDGRATERRLNGYEYENAVRDLLQAPWLQLRHQFPGDGEAFRFNKVGEALDVSHVQISRYLSAADYAIRQVLAATLDRPPSKITRNYARDSRGRFQVRDGDSNPDRLVAPVLGLEPQAEVRAGRAPSTVGTTDPGIREQEAIVLVQGQGGASVRAPVAGKYRIRARGYTVWVGPGSARMKFEGLAPDRVPYLLPYQWQRPNFDDLSAGRRDEPITVYAQSPGSKRRVGAFDFTGTPTVKEVEVTLAAGESVSLDASRLYYSRPAEDPLGFLNPLAQRDGMPGVAFQWTEIEGPLDNENTSAGYRLLFGDLPLQPARDGKKGAKLVLPVVRERQEGNFRGGSASKSILVEAVTRPSVDESEPLLRTFMQRAYRRPVLEPEVKRYLDLIRLEQAAGRSFTEAMITGYKAVLASPGFILVEEKPGRLDDYAVASRLAFFLWNSEPDATLRSLAQRGDMRQPTVLKAQVDRLLDDPRSARFIEAFTDYWLDLRKIQDTTPSVTLYNDYYLDDMLIEASLDETRLYVADLFRRNLPARAIVDSDFTFLNEHLAAHYGIAGVAGVAMRRVTLPAGSLRGGLMTQASVLKVTANGTTTSPVLRGHWINERILGRITPPPPPVGAVEPDIRGATTIREQLAKHRADPSCASCHSQMDPPGFALESFDVFGKWRDRYRGVAENHPAVPGFGKNGHVFQYYFAKPVDASGELADGRSFQDVRELKRLLLQDEVQIARNLAQQLLIYATGAKVHFADRAKLEEIIARAAPSGYGARTLVHELVQSELFLEK